MNKTMSIIAVVAGLLFTETSAARAQTPTPPSSGGTFLSIGLGAQGPIRTFSHSSTFVSFNETGTVDGNQNVGRGFVVDVTGGFQFSDHAGVAIGLWTASAKGDAAATASIPDPLFYGRFTTVSMDASDLKQLSVGLNLQFVWTMPVAARIDLALFGGPTVIYVRQEIGSIAVEPNTANASLSVVRESKTTAKAGNAGVDLRYRISEHYGADVFVRYAGGQADLPSAQNLDVGGVQIGGGVRYRF